LTLTATPDPYTDAQIAVFMNSRDWGAWGTLNVNIRLAGQTIKGHFAGDDTTDILLPKRQQGSLRPVLSVPALTTVAQGNAFTVDVSIARLPAPENKLM
jgi:hypothetical protein